MAVVDGVAQLEREDGVGAHGVELVAQLGRRQPVLVQAVVPAHAFQHLQLAADQPVAAALHQPNVRVVAVRRSKLPRATLLLKNNKQQTNKQTERVPVGIILRANQRFPTAV